VFCMKFARFEAVVIAATILVSAVYAKQTGTIEPDAPPSVELPPNPAVALATAQSTICSAVWTKTMASIASGGKPENCAKQD
jgi:hypothetical protein